MTHDEVPHIDAIRELRDWYNDQVRSYIEGRGEKFVDKALSAEGVRYILEQLELQRLTWPSAEHMNADGTSKRTFAVLDMGMGLSTIVVGDWCRSHGYRYLGVDHDEQWVQFVRRTLMLHRAIPAMSPLENLYLYGRVGFERMLKQVGHVPFGGFDAVIVDHGPQLEDRANDTPWLSSLLTREGVMYYDDWRPKHEGRIRRAFAKLGPMWKVGDAGDAIRRYPRDKSIGWARRS